MNWSDRYGVFKAECGILTLQCIYSRGAYTVRVNDHTLKRTYSDIGEAQAAAIRLAQKLLKEADKALATLTL